MSITDYARIERAIRYLDEHASERPDLKDIAADAGLSEFHFQRLFRRWAGVSPKRFQQYIAADRARRLLESRSTLDASYQLGLSSGSRLHDLVVGVNAVTPGEVRSGGAGLEIRWGAHPTPFGECLIGTTSRGICELAFLADIGPTDALSDIAARWPAAKLVKDVEGTGRLVEQIFARAGGGVPVTLLLRGTNFQLQVWRALLEIPPGRVTSYGEVARAIGSPSAARAVGSAVGANRIGYLIPCHRVIRRSSAFGEYRWGVTRKRAILAWEALLDETAPPVARNAGAR